MPGPTPCPLHLPCRKKLSGIRAVAPHPWTAPAPIPLPRRTGEPHKPRVTPSQDPRNGAWWKRGGAGNAAAMPQPLLILQRGVWLPASPVLSCSPLHTSSN